MVIGLGMTGVACCEALGALDAEVIVTDTRDDILALKAEAEKAEARGAIVMKREAAKALRPETVIVSPGVSISHPLVEGFRAGGAEVISEIELAFRLAEGRMVAITGTNGKTTTTGLAGEILSAYLPDVRVTGNIGFPLIKDVMTSDRDTVFVTEISSYQLEGCSTLKPHIAVVLNVQPDHLERHGSMEAYAAAKRKLIEKQGAGDFAVLNTDDPIVREMAANAGAEVMRVSVREEVELGGFKRDGTLTARTGCGEAIIGETSKMSLIGDHNHCNALAAGLCGLLMGAPAEGVREKVESFKGYPHRIEKVAELGGVLYIDDSKSTNTDSTLAAMNALGGRPLILILGGDDKGLDYSHLYDSVKGGNVKRVVTLGPGLRRMAGELIAAGYDAVDVADDMDAAVRAAAENAAAGDVVLLSPASSSFDLFKNYEHRGESFKDAVKSRA